jgi:hypothetical protein
VVSRSALAAAAATLVVCLLVFPAVAVAQGGKVTGTVGAAGALLARRRVVTTSPIRSAGALCPRVSSFGIVGVNDGIVYSANPCLGTGAGASELAWAERHDGIGGAILYANTADPGPALSSH